MSILGVEKGILALSESPPPQRLGSSVASPSRVASTVGWEGVVRVDRSG